MENKALYTIEKYNMLQKGDTIVVGLSGGADSCALLHYLVTLREKYGLLIIACHVNHMIRGEEADRDENFARDFCKKSDVPFRLLKIDVPKIAKEKKEGTEKCARDIRYAFFEKTAGEFNAKIATAHTASDNAETVLFNIARGCGLKGLSGIPPVRDNIIRPLIMVTREEIEIYCRKNNINYVTDSTNLEDEYTRNKIRHNVIPVLEEINTSFISNVSKMTEIIRRNEEYLYNIADNELKKALVCKGNTKTYKVNILNSMNDAIFSQSVFILLKKYNIIPDRKHISLIREICHKNGVVQIKGNIFAVSKQGMLRIIEKVPFDNTVQIPLNFDNDIVINNKKIELKRHSISEFNKAEKNKKILFINSGDCDTIPNRAVFRYRKSGDIFRLPERNITKSLKKLFIELKIPAENRDKILVLANGNDVIWIDGLGFSERYGVTKITENVLNIAVSDN